MFVRFAALTRLLCAPLAVLLLAGVGQAQAHPHAWIDVRSTLLLDDAGQIQTIEQEWLFDELYTAALIDGMRAGAALRPGMVAQYTGEVIENLAPYGYFMRVRADGQALTLAPVTQYEGGVRDKRFVLRFTAPLAQPVDPRAQVLEFSVYDPTYFIQMLHQEADPPRVQGAGAQACHVQVHEPTPGPALFARAFALDRGAPPDDTLGELFAQKVRLQCR